MKQNRQNSNSKFMPWFAALKHSVQAALRIDRSQFTALQAIPGTIGVALPLVIGVLTGHVVGGVSLAGGAAMTGSVGLTYSYRARIRTLLLACTGVAVSAFVGSMTGRIGWLSVLAIGIWGVGAGMLVALDQSAMVVGLQSVVALIILTHFELDPIHALEQAALMFAGALLQTILILLPSPWKSTSPERSALSVLYQKLTDYAVNPSSEQSRQVRNALIKAQTMLYDSDTRSQREKILSGLLEEAEQIRLSLMLLARSRQNLEKSAMGQTATMEQLDQIRQATVASLQKIVNELKPASRASKLSDTRPSQHMKAALAVLRGRDQTCSSEETIQEVLRFSDALRDQLHRARKLATSWKYAHQGTRLPVRSIPRRAYLQLHNAQAILRANFTPRSATFRHAMRLGVTLALATTMYLLLPPLRDRGYWIPLTALLVLRSDFASTFMRGMARMLGTMLGAVLAALLASLILPHPGILVIAIAITVYLAYSVLFANYAIFSVFITIEVVFLLAFVIPQPPLTAAYRAIDTAIGGTLALIMYIAWPTWEQSRVPAYIADHLEAIRHYFVAVMESYIHPEAYRNSRLYELRKASRLAHSNAEASLQRAQQEPEPHHTDLELAQNLFDTEITLATSILTLEAYLIDNPAHQPLPMVTEFSKKVDQALRILATSLREGQAVTALPDLQEALRRLQAERPANRAQPELSADLRFVIAEARRIVTAVNALSRLISLRYASSDHDIG
ncbi:MAG TPA: FUSC family protein [Ktedonobacteraceae bacterium]|nr:FUSC family protein [Ktedonobacteraceae bacterium]